MTPFTIILQDMSHEWHSDTALSFIGRDMSGSFGLQANHETLVTALVPGLARFRCREDQRWLFIAQPGSVVQFFGNTLRLATTQFLLSDNHDLLLRQMDAAWQAAEQTLRSTRRSYVQVEQALARKIWEISRQGGHFDAAG